MTDNEFQTEFPNASLLLVDDNIYNLSLLGELLNEVGYQVHPVTDGVQALELLQHQHLQPDLILLDIQMPKLDGFQVCVELKKDESIKDIPVIFISAAAGLDEKVKGFELGGVDYITKPFEEREILMRINTHLRLHFLKRDLHEKIVELERANIKIKELSIRDDLTGLYNRRYFNEQARNMMAHAHRYQEPFSITLSDIDSFKMVNDRFSHAIGDEVLRRIAEIISNNIRDADLAARYGGEEFVIAFSSTPLSEAVKACEKLRIAIEQHPWQEVHPELRVTISMGISADLDVKNHEQMIAEADKKLYEAKYSGKNCVRF